MTKLLFRFTMLFVLLTVLIACSSSSDDSTPTNTTDDDTATDTTDDTSSDTDSEDPESYFRVASYISRLTFYDDPEVQENNHEIVYDEFGRVTRILKSSVYYEAIYDTEGRINLINYGAISGGLYNTTELFYNDQDRVYQYEKTYFSSNTKDVNILEFDALNRVINFNRTNYDENDNVFLETTTEIIYDDDSPNYVRTNSETTYQSGTTVSNSSRYEFTDIPVVYHFGEAVGNSTQAFFHELFLGIRFDAFYLDKVYKLEESGTEVLSTSFEYSFNEDGTVHSQRQYTHDKTGEISSDWEFVFSYAEF